MDDACSGHDELPSKPLCAAINAVELAVFSQDPSRTAIVEAVDADHAFPIDFDTSLATSCEGSVQSEPAVPRLRGAGTAAPAHIVLAFAIGQREAGVVRFSTEFGLLASHDGGLESRGCNEEAGVGGGFH